MASPVIIEADVAPMRSASDSAELRQQMIDARVLRPAADRPRLVPASAEGRYTIDETGLSRAAAAIVACNSAEFVAAVREHGDPRLRPYLDRLEREAGARRSSRRLDDRTPSEEKELHLRYVEHQARKR